MVISKVPGCPSRIETPNKIFKKPTANHFRCRSMRCFINIVEKWHIVKLGTAEQWKMEYRNTKSWTVKPGYGMLNPGQTVSSTILTRINQDQLTALHKSLSWLSLFLESAKFKLGMTSIFSQGSCWKDRARVEFTFTRGLGHVSEAAFHYAWQY